MEELQEMVEWNWQEQQLEERQRGLAQRPIEAVLCLNLELVVADSKEVMVLRELVSSEVMTAVMLIQVMGQWMVDPMQVVMKTLMLFLRCQ